MKVALPLLSCVFAFGMVGCGESSSSSSGSSEPASTQTPPTANVESTPALPADAPTVIVATTGTGAPITYKSEQGSLMGIDVDVVKAVGAKEGFKVEVIQVAWKDLFTGLDEKKYDIAVAGISWTEERSGKYGLSDSYFANPTSVIYKAGVVNNPQSLSDFSNVRMGVLKGSSYEKLVQSAGIKQITQVDKGFVGFSSLVRGDFDAYIHSNINLRYLKTAYADKNLEIQVVESPTEPSAQNVMALNKSNTELLAKVNSGIAKLKAEGAVEQIINKHLAMAHMEPENKN